MFRLTIIILGLLIINVKPVANNGIQASIIKSPPVEEERDLLTLLKQEAPYPYLAYTTVVAESGWNNSKSHLAKTINNNLGMTPSTTRCHAATLKDTAKIRKKLKLTYGKDYSMYKVRNTIIKNGCGDTLLAYNNRWAIYLSPRDCAKDIATYQKMYISENDAKSPEAYINRLISLNYCSDANYKSYWLAINKMIKKKYEKDYIR